MLSSIIKFVKALFPEADYSDLQNILFFALTLFLSLFLPLSHDDFLECRHISEISGQVILRMRDSLYTSSSIVFSL